MNTDSSPPSGHDAAEAALVKALTSLHRACEGCALYGSEHAAVRKAAERAGSFLTRALPGLPTSVLGVAKDQILGQDGPLDGPPELVGLARLLHAREISALEFMSEVTGEAIMELAGALRERSTGATLSQEIHRRTAGAIRLVPIHYGVLSMRESTVANGGDGPTWTALARTLMGDPTSGVSVAPEDLAARVNDASVDEAEAELEQGRDQLCDMADRLRDAPADARRHSLSRLARFLDGLSPRLRQALLAVQPGAAERSIAVIESVAEVLPLNDVLEALETVDAREGEPNKEAMRLYGKLARIAHRVPMHASRIDRLLHRGSCPELMCPERDERIRRSVAETLGATRSAEYNPEDYEHTLDAASQTSGDTDGRDGVLRRVDPAELCERVFDTALRVIEMADATTAEVGAGPFEYLQRATIPLLERGRVDLVVSAVRAAQNGAKLRSPGPERHAAGDLLQHMRTPDVLEAVLEQCCVGAEWRLEKQELLELGGSATVSAALRRLSTGRTSALQTPLRELVLDSTVEQLFEAVRGLASDDPSGLKAVQSLLSILPPDRAVEVLEPLCADAAASVRFLAFEALSESGWIWPASLMRQGLVDSEGDVRRLAADQLASQGDPQSTRLLVSALTGRLDGAAGRPIEPDLFERLVDVLDTRPGGDERLVEIAGGLRWSFRRDCAVAHWCIVRRLWQRRSDRVARGALMRWLLSTSVIMLAVDLANRPLWERNR